MVSLQNIARSGACGHLDLGELRSTGDWTPQLIAVKLYEMVTENG